MKCTKCGGTNVRDDSSWATIVDTRSGEDHKSKGIWHCKDCNCPFVPT